MEARLDQDPVLKAEDPELMRAMPTRVALRSRWLWGASAGGEETFALFRPVATIDTFLSHEWQTAGWLKMAGLAFYLNTPRAVAAAVFLHAVLHALELAGVYSFPIPPVYGDARMFDGSDVVPSLRLQMHCALPMVLFFVVLRYGQELPWGRRSCFLDKCCIHQTDEGKKAAGIKQLGAFLRYSERLVVLWQPKSFTRLWCVYELAAFMHINEDCRRVSFLPLKLSVFAIALSLFYSVATVCFVILLPWTLLHPEHAEWVAEAVPEAAQYPYLWLVCVGLNFVGLYALTSPFFWIFCKWHMRDRKELLQQVSSFEFESAECQEESDREFVRGQIEHWFGDVAQFEHYVRTAVAERIEEMLNEQGPVPYEVVTVGSLSHILVSSTIIINALQDRIPNLVNICIAFASICFFTDAIAMRLIMGLAGTTFGDASGASTLGRLSGPLATAMIFSVCLAVPLALITPAAPEWLAISLVFLELGVTCALYFPRSALGRMLPAATLRGADVPAAA